MLIGIHHLHQPADGLRHVALEDLHHQQQYQQHAHQLHADDDLGIFKDHGIQVGEDAVRFHHACDAVIGIEHRGPGADGFAESDILTLYEVFRCATRFNIGYKIFILGFTVVESVSETADCIGVVTLLD